MASYICVGWGTPAIALLTKLLRHRRADPATVIATVGFYILVGGAWLTRTAGMGATCFIALLLLAGPVLAIYVALAAPPPKAQKTISAFPVIPLDSGSSDSPSPDSPDEQEEKRNPH